jgi:hypothetical protein
MHKKSLRCKALSYKKKRSSLLTSFNLLFLVPYTKHFLGKVVWWNLF